MDPKSRVVEVEKIINDRLNGINRVFLEKSTDGGAAIAALERAKQDRVKNLLAFAELSNDATDRAAALDEAKRLLGL